jgi:hypothetical protein
MIDEPVTQYQVECKDDQRTDNKDDGERCGKNKDRAGKTSLKSWKLR